jgi:hypothetical protein
MEVAKTAYGAILVFVGGILLAVGFLAILDSKWITGVPVVIFGGYLTTAVYHDNLLKNLRHYWNGKHKNSS